jgi:hypothetical protein
MLLIAKLVNLLNNADWPPVNQALQGQESRMRLLY